MTRQRTDGMLSALRLGSWILGALLLLPTASVGQEDAPIQVGSKKFTEAVILGEAASQWLVQQGSPAEHRRELGGTRVLWNALLAGDIDVYGEYTGTLLQEILAGQSFEDDGALRQHLAGLGLGMTDPLGFNNTYALGMRRSVAQDLGIQNISDLTDHPDLVFGFTNEFLDRQDGWKGLRAAYRLPQTNVTGLDHDLAYRGLVDDALQVVDLYSTDAEIDYYDLRVLQDDLAYFPEYQAIFLYRLDLAQRVPPAIAALEQLAGTVDEATMVALNARVKIDRQSETQAAADFLGATFDVAVEVEEADLWQRLGQRTGEHLVLVGISLFAAIFVALPLGVVAARRPRLGQWLLGGAGILQTIPSLALLVFMIPFLGIGAPPAMMALFLYSLLPILRNTAVGLSSLPGELTESAAALGLSSAARLRLVELPLAAPAILAGIKTSAVINIGTATLGALIGAGGYGQPILTGIRLDDIGLILEGAIPAAVLALLAQGLFDLSERWLVSPGLRE